MAIFGFLSKEKKEKLDKGLEKTKQGFFSRIARAVAGKSKVDDDFLDDFPSVTREQAVKFIDLAGRRAVEDVVARSA